MPEDIEVMRLRAKAKAKALRMRAEQAPKQETVGDAFSASGEMFNKGIEQAKQGSPVAGGLNMATGALSAPFAPIGAGIQALRDIPKIPTPFGNFDAGGGLANVLSIPPFLISKGIEGGTNLISKGLNAIGIEDKPTEESQALNNLNQTVGQYLLAPVVAKEAPKVTNAISSGLRNVGTKLEQKAINPSFTKKQGLKVVDRKVNTAYEGNYAPTRSGIEKLDTRKEQLNQASKTLAERGTKEGKTIRLDNIYKMLDDVLKKEERSGATYAETVKEVNDVMGRLDRIKEKYPDGNIPLDIANELKGSFQDLAYNKYDQTLPPSQSQIKLYKDTGHKLLDEIIQTEPRLRKVGLEQRDLIELKPELERRVKSEGSNPYLNWKMMKKMGISTAAGTLSGSTPVGAATYLATEALTNPTSLHYLAQGARKAGDVFAYPDVTGTPLYGGRYNSTIPYEMRQKLIRELGLPENISNKELIKIAKKRNVFSNAPMDEAPVSRGGNMGVRGKNTQEQMRRNKK